MINEQKITNLCSILDELFDSFRPAHPLEHSKPNPFFECIIDSERLERLKTQYEKIKEG